MKKQNYTSKVMRTQTLGIRLTVAEKKAINQYCDKTAMTMSKVVRKLFEKLINGEITFNNGN